jgi:disulfide bond formation protein DsbB
MSSLSTTVITIFSILTLIGQILGVLLIIFIILSFLNRKNKKVQKLQNLISENYIILILIISAVATVGSLTFSIVLGFAPCELCWYQRIFMYPQVVVSFLALLMNDIKAKYYLLTLSIIGILISSYHNLLQFFPNKFQCSDEVVHCSTKQFAFAGYITIPVMAWTAFALIILICIIQASRKH